MYRQNKGFTLIELLVVIAIIGILSSVVLASLNSARQKGRDAKRLSDLTQISTALEMYYHDNNAYPNPVTGWRSECPDWGSFPSNDVIPGLVPTYLPSFPSDPSMDKVNNWSCYLYYSNGADYALLDHNVQDPGFSYASRPTFVDPARDGGSDPASADPTVCILNGTTPWAWKVSSQGGRCF
ncbi:MAG: type II secretion system protein [bacterium]|nr:type II secretion system protein [bacterium]